MLGIWNPHTLLMGINKATIILWKTVWQFLKRLTRWPNTSTPRCIQNRTEHTTQASTNVGSGMIPKSHKVKIPQVYINWWTDRQNALQPHSKSTTWVSLRNVTLSGRSQTHTHKKADSSIRNVQEGRTVKTEHRSGMGQGWGWRRRAPVNRLKARRL